MPSVRRLTAILAADVAGYSRLMGADEEGMHERLTAHLRELVDPKIKEDRGRTVKNTGDGLLAEFASVVNAVRCAVEVPLAPAYRRASRGSSNAAPFPPPFPIRVGFRGASNAAARAHRRVPSCYGRPRALHRAA
jgi:class 3 adenylate cyclase